jgi:ubiquitin-conjugating enzyme E2 W
MTNKDCRSSKRYRNTAHQYTNRFHRPRPSRRGRTRRTRTHAQTTTRARLTLNQMTNELPPGITIVSADNFSQWLMDMRVESNPLYADETYRLKFVFSPQYPIEVRTIFHTLSVQPRRSKVANNSVRTHANKSLPQPPEVTFVRDEQHSIPWHPHIYSNGIICLDLLDRSGWSPVHNVESVCVSLQSMLHQNQKKERPEGDENFVRYNTQRPRDINFVFHDDTV